MCGACVRLKTAMSPPPALRLSRLYQPAGLSRKSCQIAAVFLHKRHHNLLAPTRLLQRACGSGLRNSQCPNVPSSHTSACQSGTMHRNHLHQPTENACPASLHPPALLAMPAAATLLSPFQPQARLITTTTARLTTILTTVFHPARPSRGHAAVPYRAHSIANSARRPCASPPSGRPGPTATPTLKALVSMCSHLRAWGRGGVCGACGACVGCGVMIR